MDAETNATTLRERKRLRTKRQLIEAGYRLFQERGYDATTVAEIAAAAEIGTRTFFTYFDTKEQLLFPDDDPRVDAVLEAIATRSEDESPSRVLIRSMDSAAFDAEATSAAAQLRMRLMPDVPAIQARALRSQLDAQSTITRALAAAYPKTDALIIAALTGAFIGAVAASFQHLADAPDAAERKRRIQKAVSAVLP